MFSGSDLVGAAKSGVMDMAALSSKWDGLSSHLIASFYEVKKGDGGAWGPADGPSVKAPLLESNLDISLGWQSPFESAGPESKAPMLMAMLQSGVLQPMVDAMMSKGDKQDGGASSGVGDAQKKSSEFLKQFEGRTGITKLNSTQVFSGMPPVKIQVTALFRAWSDPVSEVEAPMNQLVSWSLPVFLEKDSTILSNTVEAAKGEKGYIEALMPSKSPVTIAMKYKGRLYSPLVIESVGVPISSPIDSSGNFIELSVPLTLCSLTAIDRDDWAKSKAGAGGLLNSALGLIF